VSVEVCKMCKRVPRVRGVKAIYALMPTDDVLSRRYARTANRAASAAYLRASRRAFMLRTRYSALPRASPMPRAEPCLLYFARSISTRDERRAAGAQVGGGAAPGDACSRCQRR